MSRHLLVLLRHGESAWNRSNRFTGWFDADLTTTGEDQARAAGAMLAEHGVLPNIVHTSLQVRAVRTASLALEQASRAWIPVRRHWRLNERHYGDLTGLNKAEVAEQVGPEQILAWRRGYDTRPPQMRPDHPFDPSNDPRYASLPAGLIPRSECLSDVTDRLLPYWFDQIVPDLINSRTVLVVAHGNSLRALVKHLDTISNHDIERLEIPMGVPLIFELTKAMTPTEAKPTLERCLLPAVDVRNGHD